MNKKLQLATIILFVGVLFAFSIAFFVLPDQSFSAEENRSLRSFPKFTWKKLALGTFGDEINDYFADQFPARDLLVGLKGYTENALGKGENNGVILGKDGSLSIREGCLIVSAAGQTDIIFRGYVDELKISELMSLDGAIIIGPDIEHDGIERTIIAYYKYYR